MKGGHMVNIWHSSQRRDSWVHWLCCHYEIIWCVNNEHTQAHVPTPDQRASSWLSRDLVLYGRSFKSVTNAKE